MARERSAASRRIAALPPGAAFPPDILGHYQRAQNKPFRVGTVVILTVIGLGFWGALIAALGALEKENPVLWSFAAVSVSLIAIYRQDVALILFSFFSAVSPEAPGAAFRTHDLALPLLVTLGLCRIAIQGAPRVRLTPAIFCLAIPTFYCVQSMLFFGGQGIYPLGLRYLTTALLFALIVTAPLKRQELVRTLEWGTLLIILGLLMWVFGFSATGAHGPTGEHRSVYGTTAIFTMLVGIVMWINSPSRWRYMVSGLICCLGVTIAIFSTSRTPMVTLLVGTLLLTFFYPRRSFLTFLVAGIMFCAIALPVMAYTQVNLPERAFAFLRYDGSVASRHSAYLSLGARMVEFSPLSGNGLASHNLGWYDSEWLRAAYEHGIPGLALLIAWIGYLGYKAFSRERRDVARSPERMALFILVAACAVNMFALVTLSAVRTSELFASLAGLLLAAVIAGDMERAEAQKQAAVVPSPPAASPLHVAQPVAVAHDRI